uniref:Proline dehydrogenase n=1 Tax=Megaviridae environmental sample TaxID=1737588 RepID=A0A5J6VKK4_9VIRU|nr:MAG: proline dehydrogenase [Megaviridae environmental sample]
MYRLPVYSKFIAGNNLQSAIKVSNKLKNVKPIFDFSVETTTNKNRNVDEIFKQINTLDSSFIALKFSSLEMDNVKDSCDLIDQFYKENNKKTKPNRFLIDAENYLIQNKIYEISDYAIDSYNTKREKHFYKTLQMYRNDVIKVYNDDINKFMKTNKYALKLVRGAYISTDKKYDIITKTKYYTDFQYNNSIDIFCEKLQNYPNNDLIIATHNPDSYNIGIKNIKKSPEINKNIFFATLLGMGDSICYDNTYYNKLKYIPYGPFFETTPYLFRRLVENIDIIKHI